ncbi:MAG: ABC transporter substrate-binding protein [Burkholderiales bacterium RIFCSPLOWO2_12_67_14]|nr:MAG: ABC transporter substrate-binding protein [Burkholderiales bacterium RIFCSPLOWO2_02_FULL_67_64]OGB49557.1 MAG: ABC transporter substrate-binding protein [Burkholderiales bacterium RIFCSPLOWO2_12_67_14]OGB51520.1 MAG: ABC transporter substrate-binding protein [Burkholderiales bacterium RIFCSPHIGHO2_12_FULL_67_38]
MWTRRGWCRVCASALLGTAPPATWAQAPGPAPLPRAGGARVVVAVEDKSAFCYLPLTVAERMGYFASEGLDVQVREFTDPGQALQAVLLGSAQVFSGPYSSIINMQARGQMFQSFVLQGRAPQIVLGVSLQTLGHYSGLRDLRGKKLGIMAHGSGTHRVARLVLARAGLGAQDVQYTPLPSATSAVAAFRAGTIDAICYTDPVITQLEQGGELKVVADTRTVRGSAEVFGGTLPAACLSAPGAFLAGNARQCQALANAMVHALKWLQTAGPSDIIKAVPERYFLGDRALYLAAFSRAREAWAPDGVMPEDGPATAARMLAYFDPSAPLQRVDLARTFTNDFARKAKARFKA